MTLRRLALGAVCAVALSAGAAMAQIPPPPTPVSALPAGDYTLDKNHSTVMFKVSHLGFSFYHASFRSFDARLNIDPKAPAGAKIDVTIDPKSLEVPPPPEGFLDTLKGKDWLDVAQYPTISFKSTKVTLTGKDTAKVTGDFTLHGVTKPVTLDVRFNGGYPGLAGMDPHARIGFSAKGTFKRSDFGMGYGVPAPGTTMGVGDDVAVDIETEFNGPALAAK